MSLWDALRMNMMISYQELVRTFPKFQLLAVCYPKCKDDEVMLILRWRVADLYAHELEVQNYIFRELEGIIEKITGLPETYFVSSGVVAQIRELSRSLVI